MTQSSTKLGFTESLLRRPKNSEVRSRPFGELRNHNESLLPEMEL